jgi:hypothetical protein
MVSWGPNTTFTYGGATPAPANGAPSGGPPPVPTFGSTPAPSAGLSSFGMTPASSPSTGGGFGFGSSLSGPTQMAPASTFGSGGLFGTPSSAAPATTSLFGSPPPSQAPTSSPGLFGAPASGGLFGNTTSSLFGGSAMGGGASLTAPSMFGGYGASQQQQQQHIPAQAAIQAHMNASALQEEQRVKVQFEKLYRAYTGSLEVQPDSQEQSKFVAIVYNELSPAQIQQQFFSGIGNTGQILAPPRPLQVSEKEWTQAIISNPDPTKFVPQPIIGAVALQSRVTWQQDKSKEYAGHAKSVQASLDFIRRREARAKQDLHEKERKLEALQQQLLQVMTKVELARCFNKTLQPDEYRALQRLTTLIQQLEGMRSELASLQTKARSQITTIAHHTASGSAVTDHGLSTEMKHELRRVLNEQREKLERATVVAKKDLHDMELIQERVVATVPSTM